MVSLRRPAPMIGSSSRTMPMGRRKNRPMPNIREKARVEARIQPGDVLAVGFVLLGVGGGEVGGYLEGFYAEDEGF